MNENSYKFHYLYELDRDDRVRGDIYNKSAHNSTPRQWTEQIRLVI